MKRMKDTGNHKANGAIVGYEVGLWRMADALRGSMDAAEYKHVVLGLIFLKYISDAFEEHRKRLEQEPYADPEDPDEYRAQNIFWVPPEARWDYLRAHARQPTIGQLVDDAMEAIERNNPVLKGVLPKDYARPALDKMRLGQLIDLVSNIQVGDEEARSKDVLGRVYEYFLKQVDFLNDEQVGWGSTEFIVLRPRAPLPAEFGYCLAPSERFRDFAIQSMTGTSSRQRVQADSLEHFRLPRMPPAVAEAFGHEVKPLFMRSSAAVRESRTLAALRDALLPKLISGEIRVKDAERFLKERGL